MLAILLIVTFAINIFFGYWRASVRALSLQWFLAIHLSVPVIIGLRVWLLDWNWVTVPAFVAVFFLGQYAGGRVQKYLVKKPERELSACLVMDLFRMARGGGGN